MEQIIAVNDNFQQKNVTFKGNFPATHLELHSFAVCVYP